ncbi:ATP-binding protein [Candidatus Woesearchaeota archaeon]|nr:ATP-binding protein [Candidatus Woesearchaeota archaeon]
MALNPFMAAILPLNKRSRQHMMRISPLLANEKSMFDNVRRLLKQRRIGVAYNPIPSSYGRGRQVISLHPLDEDSNLQKYLDDVNKVLEIGCLANAFKDFARTAHMEILKLMAPQIMGLDEIKDAALLQLFCRERVHMLLLGDPGTGKTDILRAIDSMAPISSFGLGSGTSKAGLSVTLVGKEVVKGLLPLANDGICCIDELNLMMRKDRASLLNAMEKGFITYDKGSSHIKMDANTKVLATANPVGDRFVRYRLETYKKQMPFDSALISRFHLLFIIKKADVEQFIKISQNIISSKKLRVNTEDVAFVKKFVEYALEFDVEFPKELENKALDFVRNAKQDEDKFLIDLTPRIVHGLVALCKASARIELRNKVTNEDVSRVIKIVKRSLYV